MKGGQAIVEVVVALGIAIIVIVALVGLVTSAVSNTTFAKTQGGATRLSREAMEWARSERDRNWNAFASRAGSTWCLSSLTWPGAAGSCAPSATISGTDLRREVTLSTLSDTEIGATVVVYWSDVKGSHEVRLNSRFTKWR